MKAISQPEFRNLSPTIQLDRRARPLLSFLAVSGVFIALLSFLLHFGLALDISELLLALEANATPEFFANLGMAALLLTSFILCRHYLLLLGFVKTLRAVFRRFLRRLRAPAPALRSVSRSAHGSRAPPFSA